jgi:hypothetical protein
MHITLPVGMRPLSVLLEANAVGGFTLSGPTSDFGRTSGPKAAFTTLDDALEWLRVNMARPAQDHEPGKAVLS